MKKILFIFILMLSPFFTYKAQASGLRDFFEIFFGRQPATNNQPSVNKTNPVVIRPKPIKTVPININRNTDSPVTRLIEQSRQDNNFTPTREYFGKDNPTRDEIKAFQSANNLKADGIIGPKTNAAIVRELSDRNNQSQSGVSEQDFQDRKTATPQRTSSFQDLLNQSNTPTSKESALQKLLSGVGVTKKEVVDFQKENDLKTDGIVGPDTTAKINEELAKLGTESGQDKPQSNTESTPTVSNCGSASVIEGDSNYIIGCGKATTFGHKTDGTSDSSKDDGNVFCNPSGDKSKYTYRRDRSSQANLNVKVAALRAKDIGKIFNISLPTSKGRHSSVLFAQLAVLSKNRNKFCGKMITVKDLNTGKEITVPLMDVMSNNDKLIDLTGGAMKELGANGKEPTLNKVQITWGDSPKGDNTQVAEAK